MLPAPIWPLLIGAAAIPVCWLAGRLRPRFSSTVFAVAAGAAFIAAAVAWHDGRMVAAWNWAPSWNLEFAIHYDGLAALYTLLITGTGAVVGLYASGYMPDHVADHQVSADRQVFFSLWMLVFMTSMVGLVLSADLLMLFIFWDLTTVASFFLIAFDADARAQSSARMAMIITGASAVGLMVAVVMVYTELETFSVLTTNAQGVPEPLGTAVAALVVVAAVAKSAQFPLHIWLPRAMAAPTPVSAYLHSAAMVAAGVYLIARLSPLIADSALVSSLLPWIGLASMGVGSLMALTSDDLKELLAYSTIAQYGYVWLLLGLGGAHGYVGAGLYVLVHGMAKAALFMVAGAVTDATGETELSEVGGLASEMPALATVCGTTAAALAALPPTLGFFKDELLFQAAFASRWWFPLLAIVAAGLTLAYLGRFFAGIFLGDAATDADPIPSVLWLAPAIPASLLVAGGLWPAPFAHLAEQAARAMTGREHSLHVGYKLAYRPAYLAALGAWAFGGLVWWATARKPNRIADWTARIGALGPATWYRTGLSMLEATSRWLLRVEERELPSRLLFVLVPTAALVATALVGEPLRFDPGIVRAEDLPLILGLALAVTTGLIIARAESTRHLEVVLALTVLGFSLAAVYLLLNGANVTLVAVLVEIVLTIVMLGVLGLIPRSMLESPDIRAAPKGWRGFRITVAVAMGTVMGLVAWQVVSHRTGLPSVVAAQREQLEATPELDAVAAVLADFRALDTLGEITVVAIAALGVASMLQARRGGR
ncbi:MAG: hydrogen gas-evolving membrane-bound hydrogenase subunit E [Bradymonadaceae bacterium]